MNKREKEKRIGGRRGDSGRSDAEGGREGGRENEGNMPDYTEETYYAFDHISGNKLNSNGNIDNLSNKSDHSNGYGTSINSSNVHGVSFFSVIRHISFIFSTSFSTSFSV